MDPRQILNEFYRSRLLQYKEENDLTQKMLARIIKVSEPSLSRFLKNREDWDTCRIVATALILKMNVAEHVKIYLNSFNTK